MQRITVINIRLPGTRDVNQQLQWLGSSLGLFNLRDKDKSCFRIFIELLKTTKKNKSLSSDELAESLHLSRGTVVHHLHKLEEAGLISYESKGYILRVQNLSTLIDELEHDIQKACDQLKRVAQQIDKQLGM